MRFARSVFSLLMLSLTTAAFAQVKLETTLSDNDLALGGNATLLVFDTKVVYEITLLSQAYASFAHIYRCGPLAGNLPCTGTPAIDLGASFSSMGAGSHAAGTVTISGALADSLRSEPSSYSVGVAGALLGGLRYAEAPTSGPTTAFLPLVAHNDGQAGSTWRTDVHLASLTGSGVEITLDYYPMSAEGSALPADSRTVIVGGAGQLVLRDVLGSLFGRDGERGAMRLSAASAFGARARLYDVAPGEGAALAGATSLYSRALELPDVPTAGALLGLSNRTGLSGDGFRTNVILFNPTGNPITVTLAALADDGGLLGTRTLTVGPYANDVTPVSTLIDSVPPGSLEQASFLVKYFASGPLIVQAAEIDGAAGDGVLIDSVAISAGAPWDYGTALDGTWRDSMTFVSSDTITVCGVTYAYYDMDISGDYTAVVSQAGANVTLCYPESGGVCYEGSVLGDRLVATRTSTQPYGCGLTLVQDDTMELTIESDTVMRGTRTWTLTYSGGPQSPIRQVVIVSHVMNRQ